MPDNCKTSHSCIASIVLETLSRHPGRTALIHHDQSWTYEELGRIIAAAAGMLQKHCSSAPARIAIIGNNHPAYIAAYFAAQFVGASTVEVGRHESLPTLIKIIRDTKAAFLLTDREDLKAALETELAVDTFDDFFQSCTAHACPAPEPLGMTACKQPSDEASIIFTSGTTGTPKGVILCHGNFCFIVSAIIGYLKLTKDDRYALILPLCHTYGKTVMLTTFAVGGSVVLLENFQNLPAFLKELSEKRCTLLSAVPYHAHMLLKWGNFAKHDLSALRAITFSGNKLPSDTLDKIRTSLPHVQIFSMYGLTESTTRACYVSPEHLDCKKESCGRPLAGVELKIVAEDGSSLPSGMVGEVCLRGPNIMCGYFNDPELTAKTLVDGWLRTGDLGCVDDDGHLYLKGRMKDIIKCAGERISPAEIEEVIRQYPGVSETAVVGTPDPVLGEIVHAFVVPESSINEADLRSFCAKKLSHHKLPRRYTFVQEIPKGATGKVQKHLLKGSDNE